MKWYVFLASIVLSTGLFGCNFSKPVPSGKHSLVGHWVSDYGHLKISKEGRLDYVFEGGSKTSKVSAPIMQYSDQALEYGLLVRFGQFKIDKEPEKDASGQWSMVVDGLSYKKLDFRQPASEK